MKIQIKVIPSSSQDCIAGWLENTLKIKVKAPPEKGKANAAVIKLLEKSLLLAKGSVTIETGLSATRKTIIIHGANENIIKNKISNYCDKQH